MKKVIRLTEDELKDMVSESMKMVLNEGKTSFITVEMPVEMRDDEEVMEVFRDAMNKIGYEYYNNESGSHDKGTWVFRYAPYQAPIVYDFK